MEGWGVDYFERLLSPTGALQAVLLAAGIYFFLSFLSTSRGSGLFRGLVVAVVVIGLGLLGAAKAFEMGELEHILTENYGSVVLILVILFQPELRRGVARLGEQNKFARFVRGERPEAASEVSAAMIAMAKRRHGALVAFQRNTALDAWTQSAVKIQSLVDRRLLQGIFQPGGTLHDGAVIIDHDRLVAASCIFPLTENTELHSTIGTRHRAALGLSEETDALTVAVSEETGEISVCESGTMQRNVDPERLEGLLRSRLKPGDSGQAQDDQRAAGLSAGTLTFLHAVFLENLGRKVAALLLAGAWLYQAHENITRQINRTLTVTDEAQVELESILDLESILARAREIEEQEGVSSARSFLLKNTWRLPGAGSTPNTIVLTLPDDTHLSSAVSDAEYEVKIEGPEEEIRLLESKELTGTWTLSEDFKSGERLEIKEVKFACGGEPIDKRVKILWVKGKQPHIDLERTDEHSIILSSMHVPVRDDELDPRFEFSSEETTFSIPSVVLRGPAAQIELLKSGELDLEAESPSDEVALFKPVPLGEEDRKPRDQPLFLSEHLEELDLQLAEGTLVEARLMIAPTNWDLDKVTTDIPIVNLSETAGTQQDIWELSSVRQAEFGIQTKAVIPAMESPDTKSFLERRTAIRRFVQKHLIVFVDVSRLEIKDGEDSTTATVQWFWPPRDWRALLAEEIGPLAEQASVEIQLKTPETGELLLLKVNQAPLAPSESGADAGGPN
jgi:diadenylate cyclase